MWSSTRTKPLSFLVLFADLFHQIITRTEVAIAEPNGRISLFLRWCTVHSSPTHPTFILTPSGHQISYTQDGVNNWESGGRMDISSRCAALEKQVQKFSIWQGQFECEAHSQIFGVCKQWLETPQRPTLRVARPTNLMFLKIDHLIMHDLSQ